MPGFILCAIIYVLYIVVVEKSINSQLIFYYFKNIDLQTTPGII